MKLFLLITLFFTCVNFSYSQRIDSSEKQYKLEIKQELKNSIYKKHIRSIRIISTDDIKVEYPFIINEVYEILAIRLNTGKHAYVYLIRIKTNKWDEDCISTVDFDNGVAEDMIRFLIDRSGIYLR